MKYLIITVAAFLIVAIILIVAVLGHDYHSEINIARYAIFSGVGFVAILWLLIKEFRKRSDN